MAVYKYGGEGVVRYGAPYYGSLLVAEISLSATEDSDSLSASISSAGTLDASIAESADSGSVSAQVLVSASSASTEGSDSASCSAAVEVAASGSSVESVDSLSAAYSAVPIASCSLNATEQSDAATIAAATQVSFSLYSYDLDVLFGSGSVDVAGSTSGSESGDIPLIVGRIPWSSIQLSPVVWVDATNGVDIWTPVPDEASQWETVNG